MESQYRSASTVECPGCHLKLPNAHLEPNPLHHASGECWALYGELSAYNFERAELSFLAQLAVDAYGAQHVGGSSRPITAAFSLLGMYLVHERNFTGRQVQLAHMKLGQSKFSWPKFEPPDQRKALTVADVMRVEAGVNRDQRIHDWSKSVWDQWVQYHQWAATFCQENLRWP